MGILRRISDTLTPVTFTFAASFLLSIIAVTSGNLNRDGMLYVDAARAFNDGGLAAATQVYSWPSFSVLMGLLSELTGQTPEWCGHAMNIIFMSGTCALLVAIIGRNDPQLAWLAAAVVLSLPGLNDYRNELIREYGCWFFMLLAFRMALDWVKKPGWLLTLAIQASLLLAALFRPEVLVLYPCLILWQHFRAKPEQCWQGSLMLGSLPALGLIILLVAYFSGAVGESSRIANEMARFDFYAKFDSTAQGMSQAFTTYARGAETAHAILFFGSLSIIPWKLIGKLGIFVVPLLIFLLSDKKNERYRQHDILLWALGGYLLILAIFVLQHQFVSGRYLGPVLIFTLPFIAYGLQDLVQQFPRCRLPILSLCMVIALTNVISLKPGKQHFVEAGTWLTQHAKETPRIYNESARTAYYAGWRYKANADHTNRNSLTDLSYSNEFDLIIFEVSRKEADFQEWLTHSGLREIIRFSESNGDSIVIATPGASQQ